MRQIKNPTYQRVQFLLQREQRRFNRSEDNLYSQTGAAASLDNDQISSVEEGFLQGYLAA
ncbi:MAG TPA: hypothetical protein VJK52_02900 [Candidatus Nanoarchaeia archaeon]|nr:hypothetical protein [Candidatus Nanoarchaeia archaeon]